MDHHFVYLHAIRFTFAKTNYVLEIQPFEICIYRCIYYVQHTLQIQDIEESDK